MTRRAFQDLQAGYQPVLAFPPEPGALDLQGSGKTLGVGGGASQTMLLLSPWAEVRL